MVRNIVSNLEIDAQKRVIYRYKSPFNFIFEPEFSTGSPVGERDDDAKAWIHGAMEHTKAKYDATFVLVNDADAWQDNETKDD